LGFIHYTPPMTIDLLQKLVIIVGLPTLLAAFLYIGRKLQVLDDLQKSNERIKHNIKVISDSLVMSDLDFDHEKLRNFSPRAITNNGMEDLSQTGFLKAFEENADDFFEWMEDEDPKTKYDVEKLAIKSVWALADMPYFKEVKKYLYNKPELRFKDYALMLGVYARDKFLETHPEIKD
jgi:hypothetical protein